MPAPSPTPPSDQHETTMLHPALQAFLDDNGDRFPDLRVTREESRLLLEWGYDEIVAFMFGDDEDPSFECDDDSISGSDHFAKAVEAFAWRLLDSDEFKDVLSTASDPNAEPGTFGAIVWTKAIDLHLAEMVETADRLRAERARLNPTALADLPLFARDGARDGEE